MSSPVCFVLQKGALGMVGKELKGKEGRGMARSEGGSYSDTLIPLAAYFALDPIQSPQRNKNDMVCLFAIEYYSPHHLPPSLRHPLPPMLSHAHYFPIDAVVYFLTLQLSQDCPINFVVPFVCRCHCPEPFVEGSLKMCFA